MRTIAQMFLVILLLLAVVFAYFFYKENQRLQQRINHLEEDMYSEDNQDTEQVSTEIRWQEHLPEIQSLFAQLSSTRPVALGEQVDITGDGVPEALVFTGDGGATMDEVSLVQFVDDSPRVAQIRKADGSTEDFVSMSGAGGAGRYGGEVRLLPESNSISSSFYSVYGGDDDVCNVDVYTWQTESNLFVYNENLSNQEAQKLLAYCRNIAATFGYEYQNL